MARSCCSMNQPLFNTELLSFILIQSCCLVFLPFSLIQSCCLVFLPFSLIQSCCLIVISMQYHYTPHQSHMQICRILPPQYAEDKIFGRTRKMCRRWQCVAAPWDSPPACCLGERRRHLSCLSPAFCRRRAHPPGMPAPSLSFCCARRSTPNPNKTICIRIWTQLQYTRITY